MSKAPVPVSCLPPLTDMSSSLFFAYPQIAVIPNSGILGLTAYAFATVVPLWAFALLGPFMRRVCPEGFTMAQYVRVRFGWPVGVLLAVIVAVTNFFVDILAALIDPRVRY